MPARKRYLENHDAEWKRQATRRMEMKACRAGWGWEAEGYFEPQFR